MAQSLFEQAGAELGVRAIIDDFVERVFADPMIGFFFGKASKDRIKAKEYEFAAGHLGGSVPYTGRPLPHAHAAHPITGGHFMRRLQILKETLQDHGAPSNVIDHWLEHTESMRPFITQQAGSSCNDDASSGAANSATTGAQTAASPEATARANSNAPSPPATTLSASAKPAPSIDEINAYLERSAAMTKKRLPLVFRAPDSESTASAPAATGAASDTTAPANTADKNSRALPLVGKPVR